MTYWKNKVVVITGGSDGLGLHIAIEFAKHNATVIIASRNEERLKQATANASEDNLRLDWSVVDVTSDQSVQRCVAEIAKKHGQIDVWVNNVGKSARTSLRDCDVEQYRDLMELNFYSAVRCSLAVLPLLEQTAGNLVNIGSLASKTGWPNVAPYATSKHALAAFHHQLRIEGPAKVNYLHVCSGPIQRATTESEDRYDAKSKGLDDAAARPGGGVKLRGIPPEKLAAKIVLACRRRRIELIVPWHVRILFVVAQISPTLGDWILRKSKSKSSSK
jgi:short-subunit dehydrogenase